MMLLHKRRHRLRLTIRLLLGSDLLPLLLARTPGDLLLAANLHHPRADELPLLLLDVFFRFFKVLDLGVWLVDDERDGKRQTYVIGIPYPELLLQPLVAHLQGWYPEFSPAVLGEAQGNNLPRKALIVFELQQQTVVFGHHPGFL